MMKAATERKIIRWFHIIVSIPVIGYIYGPVKNFPNAVIAIKWVIFPLIVLSGLWMWKGHLLKRWIRRIGEKSNSRFSGTANNIEKSA